MGQYRVTTNKGEAYLLHDGTDLPGFMAPLAGDAIAIAMEVFRCPLSAIAMVEQEGEGTTIVHYDEKGAGYTRHDLERLFGAARRTS